MRRTLYYCTIAIPYNTRKIIRVKISLLERQIAEMKMYFLGQNDRFIVSVYRLK